MKKTISITAACLVTFAATPALAHTGHGVTSGLTAGLVHPVMGVDHLTAMAAVGAWSALAMSKNAFVGPVTFVLAMIVGATLSFAGFALPAMESTIALSVLVFGLMITAGARLPSSLGLGLVGFFALFHGAAHASEASGTAAAYITGFILATGAIHAVGAVMGRSLVSSRIARIAVGTLVTGSGLALVAGF